MSKITTKPNNGSFIANNDRVVNQVYQDYFDDIELSLNTNLLGNQVQLSIYTVTTLPAATTAGGVIYVSNETGGAVIAFSDGTNWRRSTDRAVVS